MNIFNNKKKIFLVLTLLSIIFQINAQNFNRQFGMPFILNFDAKAYHAHEQNFDVLQADNGKMYFANFAGILEFDGTNWAKIPMNSGMRTLCLAMNKKGRVFAGGLSDFGYLKTDIYGKTKFISLSNFKEKENKNSEIGKITHIIALDSITYFLSEERLFIYRNNKIEVLELKSKAMSAFYVKNNLYVFFDPKNTNTSLKGLTIYTNGQFKKLEKLFEEEILDIQRMVQLPNDSGITVITSKQSFYLLQNNTLSRRPILISEYINRHGISDMLVLGNNQFAVATFSGGLVILNEKAEIIQHVDKNSGLQSESINKLFLDVKGSIWLAMNDGISKVEQNYPISYINNINSGIEGKVLDIVEFADKIFVASTKGLFYLQNDKFQKINSLNYACWDLLSKDNFLYVATSNGLFYLSKSLEIKSTPVYEFTFSLTASKFSENLIYSGHNNRIKKLLITKNGVTVEKTISSIEGDVTKLIEYNGDLYFESTPNYISVFNQKTDKVQNVKLPGNVISAHLNLKENQLFISSEKGLFKIKNSNLECEKFNIIQSDSSSYQLWINHFYELPSKKFLITDGEEKNVKLFSVDAIVDGKMKDAYYTVFKPISDFSVSTVFEDVLNNKLWLGGKEGILIVNYNQEYNFKANFSTIFTKLTSLQNDSLIQIVLGKDEKLILDFESNSLKFEYSYTAFPTKGKLMFRYFLKGFDKDTSEWTSATFKDYTNLADANYTFFVEAKNEFGYIAQAAELSFKISTPLYRKWWVLIIYVGLVLFIGRIIFKWRMRATEKEKEILEEIVRERTQEIYESKKKTEEQRDIAYKQKKHILDSINYAQKIQVAVLPSYEDVHEVVFDHFILFKPRDIVSGDFYWVKRIDNYAVAVAADCTGHGVPGAFMSMLGSSFLSEIVNENTVVSSGRILDELRAKVKDSLGQEGKEGEQKDGMDISLSIINFDTLELSFSGAYNSLYIFRKLPNEDNYELIELKADRQPIGIYVKERNFSTHTFQLQKGDSLYSFSDGFVDQFGGDTGDKFKSVRFKELLQSIQDKTMAEQKELLDRAYIKWKRDLDQIDDVIVFGIRI